MQHVNVLILINSMSSQGMKYTVVAKQALPEHVIAEFAFCSQVLMLQRTVVAQVASLPCKPGIVKAHHSANCPAVLHDVQHELAWENLLCATF